MEKISKKIMELYRLNPIKRSITIWTGFQIILWIVFLIAYLINKDAWSSIDVSQITNKDTVIKTFIYIIGNNLILLLLIGFGNIFVRFGVITPGLIILIYQGVMIGLIAGSNSFEFPFSSVMEANIQYLRVGLWETTAYAIFCATTLDKSLFVSESFPAKTWTETKKLSDIKFNKTEKTLVISSIIILILAAYIEAVTLS